MNIWNRNSQKKIVAVVAVILILAMVVPLFASILIR